MQILALIYLQIQDLQTKHEQGFCRAWIQFYIWFPEFLILNIEIKTVQNVLGESLLVDFKFNSDLQYEFPEIYHTTPLKLIGYC